MDFIAPLRDRVRRGEITCSIRVWLRPRVKVGNTYALPPGRILVTRLREIGFDDITPELARRSGFAGRVDLLKTAVHGRGRRVYLVEFRYLAPGKRQE